MSKKVYYCPEIPTITRKTDRTYTHVIVGDDDYPYAWAGRFDLAVKQVDIWTKNGAKGVRMLPVLEMEKPSRKAKK